jgi:excisionase family DNA binding protein
MDKMLTAAQASKLLQVSRQTLRNWEKAGSIEVVRIGGTVRYPLSTLTKETGQNEQPKD